MSYEVYAGSRPGKPVLALTVAGIIMGVMVLLAGWQVYAARAPQQPIRIAGTPLIVQPPSRWVQDPRNPRVLYLPAPQNLQAAGIRFLKEIELEYVPAAGRPELPADSTAARVGALPAADLPIITQQFRNAPVQLAAGKRVAVTPRGDRIGIQMTAVLVGKTFNASEFEAELDQFAATVRLAEEASLVGPAAVLDHLGVTAELAGGLEAQLPRLMEQPAGYLQGGGDLFGGYRIELFRTWLATGRRPIDMLEQVVTEVRSGPPTTSVELVRSAPGPRIWRLDNPGRPGQPRRLWLVVDQPSEALLITLEAAESGVTAGTAAIAQLLETLEIETLPALAGLGDLERRGAALIETVQRDGLRRYWAPREEESFFQLVGGTEVGFEATYRSPLNGGPIAYRGLSVLRIGARKYESEYNVADQLEQYRQLVVISDVTERSSSPLLTSETAQAGAEAEVTVALTRADAVRDNRFERPRNFVPSPASDIVERLVAASDETEAGAIVSGLEWTRIRPTTAWLRPLPPTEDGLDRVLWLSDLGGSPQTMAFDENGRLQWLETDWLTMRRISAAEARARFPELRNLSWRRDR